MTFIDCYHMGFVVSDLRQSMDEFSELVGTAWAQPQYRDLDIRTSESRQRVRFWFTYSTRSSGDALIELIEGPAGTPWYPGDGVSAAFHHIGFWADDLAAESARLEEGGAALELTSGEGPSPRGFAYHLPKRVPRLELVDARRRPEFDEWMQGGDFGQG